MDKRRPWNNGRITDPFTPEDEAEYNDYLDRIDRANQEQYLADLDNYDADLQHNVMHWGGYQECVCCGDFYEAGELSELGFCPACMDELQEVDKLP